MDAFSIAISIGLQYGVPLETYVSKFTNMRFEPAGMTDDPDIRMAQSVMDYIFRRLALDYLAFDDPRGLGIFTAEERPRQLETGSYLADDAATRHRGRARGPRAVGADRSSGPIARRAVAGEAAAVKPAPARGRTRRPSCSRSLHGHARPTRRCA